MDAKLTLSFEQVGWIFIDLEVMADDHNKFVLRSYKMWNLSCANRYVCSRGKDTYFLRSNECIIAARLQNMNPSKCLECDDLEFGSKFVTVPFLLFLVPSFDVSQGRCDWK